MSGGGHIIIRSVVKAGLTEPLVRGALPGFVATPELDAILAKDIDDWTEDEHQVAAHAFVWALHHC